MIKRIESTQIPNISKLFPDNVPKQYRPEVDTSRVLLVKDLDNLVGQGQPPTRDTAETILAKHHIGPQDTNRGWFIDAAQTLAEQMEIARKASQATRLQAIRARAKQG